jgi:hypothetical protein
MGRQQPKDKVNTKEGTEEMGKTIFPKELAASLFCEIIPLPQLAKLLSVGCSLPPKPS